MSACLNRSDFAVGLVSRDSKHHNMSEIDASYWSHPFVARCILWMISELAFLSVWMVLASGDPICSVHDSAAAVYSNWRDKHCIFTTMEMQSYSRNKYHTLDTSICQKWLSNHENGGGFTGPICGVCTNALVTRLKMCTIQGLSKLSFLYHHKMCCCYWRQVLSECGVFQLCMICYVCSSPRLHTQYMLMKMINTLTLL